MQNIFRVKGRIRSCGFLRIFTYMGYFRCIGCSRVKECPAGLELPAGAINTRIATLKIQRNPPLRILTLIQFFYRFKHSICSLGVFYFLFLILKIVQWQLHRNLTFLAQIADSNQKIDTLLPPPGQMPPRGGYPGGPGSYPPGPPGAGGPPGPYGGAPSGGQPYYPPSRFFFSSITHFIHTSVCIIQFAFLLIKKIYVSFN